MQETTATVVEIAQGRLAGLGSGGVQAFLGVPYATADRFEAPLPARGWGGTFEATRFAPSAPQVLGPNLRDRFLFWYAPAPDFSEACQTLNVFTPACDGARRPVMVWLHGGGWMNLSANTSGTQAEPLAQAEDVVVVSVNHRLGVLGFIDLGHDDPRFSDAGNAGLLDIVAALRWVRENVPAFGGDPDNVTIFGQSGGAAKVAALMAMPAARGLFHKAIIQSLSGGLQIAEPEEAAVRTRLLMAEAGVSNPSDLASLPLDRLLDAQSRIPRTVQPALDGRAFMRHPFLPEAPEGSAHVPLMVGCTATETSYYMRGDLANFGIDEAALLRRLGGFLDLPPEAAARVRDAYRDTMPGATPADVLIAISTDQVFMRNTYHAAEQHARRGGTSFAYVFSHETTALDGLLKAPHCAEVPLIFGHQRTARAFVGDGPEVDRMSHRMMRTWAQFARTGSPDNDTTPEWLPYLPGAHRVMALSNDPTLMTAPGEQARSALDGSPRLGYSGDRSRMQQD